MDKIVNVFFSQPMNGLTDEEIAAEHTYMISEFRDFLINELGFDDDVIICDVNGGYVMPGPEDAGRLWYLGRSIQMMDRADYVCFHKYWRDACGCRIEMNVCNLYFSAGKNFVNTNYIGTIFWGNDSGSKDLTLHNSNDT